VHSVLVFCKGHSEISIAEKKGRRVVYGPLQSTAAESERRNATYKQWPVDDLIGAGTELHRRRYGTTNDWPFAPQWALISPDSMRNIQTALSALGGS